MDKTVWFDEVYVPPKYTKYCFVPSCKNDSLKKPDKHFFHVPNKNKSEWCRAVGKLVVPKRPLVICEDHLDLEYDLENYETWKISKGNAKLRPKVPLLKKISELTESVTEDKSGPSRGAKEKCLGSFFEDKSENQNSFNQKTEMEIEYDNSEELEYKAVEMGTTVSSDEEDPLDALETNAEHLTETNEKSSQERAQTPQSVASEVSEVNATELPQPRKRLRAEYEDVARRQKNKLEAELELTKVRVEIAEREKYKLDLELLKLERELNITHHPTFTLPIVTRSIKNEHSTG